MSGAHLQRISAKVLSQTLKIFHVLHEVLLHVLPMHKWINLMLMLYLHILYQYILLRYGTNYLGHRGSSPWVGRWPHETFTKDILLVSHLQWEMGSMSTRMLNHKSYLSFASLGMTSWLVVFDQADAAEFITVKGTQDK